MDDQESIREKLREMMFIEQDGQIELSDKLHKQHYDFAHKLLPNIIDNYFPELLSRVVNNSVQDWILQLWNNCADDSILNYCTAIYPTCKFVKPSDEIGLIYFVMPAPRANPEAAYTAVIFLIDDDSPSEWLRSYFTLELGAYIIPPVHWILGEWDNLKHINRGKFKLEPTLENFLATVIEEAQNTWC
ncbi:hypothetical protein [Fischerella sp. PCC 9605]|uniref:hypothetical protein n=1 Tax=Fischerella sp. PCC 9605 TaxID=1173024 RepID=UPI000479DDB5|nr:hypothetical protein [Fischerella sp. PCC 9605]